MTETQPYAMQIDQFGTAAELHRVAIDSPPLAPTEVRMQVSAIGLNPLDYKMRDGSSGLAKSMTMPAILGREAAGVVTEVGSEVTRFAPGDSVVGMRSHADMRGTYASELIWPEEVLVAIPDAVNPIEAAALCVTGLTALQAVDQLAKVTDTDTVLIHGAGGGVGQLMLQLAVARGATVYASASGRHAERISLHGATPIDYTTTDVVGFIREEVGTVDVVLDGVYFDTFVPSLELLSDGGRVVVLPTLADLTPATERGIEAHIPGIAPDREALTEILALAADHTIQLSVAQTFALEDVAAAHELLETGHAPGKLVAIP